MNSQTTYRGYRFPPDIISHAVWLYYRFTLSFRDIEDLLAERGIIVTYESIKDIVMWLCLSKALHENQFEFLGDQHRDFVEKQEAEPCPPIRQNH